MAKNPLGEVFGFPIINTSEIAKHHRKHRLCPYNNISANCTKDKAQNPLGVCSIFDGQNIAITCPVRFRQNWIIVADAAEFFFGSNATWTSLSEIRLNDAYGKSAGNIDLVLVSYNNDGKILDFGAVEIQGVYISGNIRQPFEAYQKNTPTDFAWDVGYNYPKADYLSSSRKRLVPQLMFKGGIIKNWYKKMGVVLHEAFFDTLPKLPEVKESEADVAWFIYGLEFSETSLTYNLVREKTVYTKFDEALNTIAAPVPGKIEDFINLLQEKLDEKLESQFAPEVTNPAELFRK